MMPIGAQRAMRVLMVAYYFPPCRCWPTASARAAGLAAGLRYRGWVSVVLTRANGCPCLEQDRSDGMPAIVPAADVIRVGVRPSRLVRLRSALTESSPRWIGPVRLTWRKMVTAALLLSERSDDWVSVAVSEGQRVIAERDLNVIWTTSGPYRSIVIGRRLRGVTGLPWIADLRDSVSKRRDWAGGSVHGWMRWIQRWRRFPALRAAEAISCVTPQEAAIDAVNLRRPVHVIPSGFDEAEWRHLRKLTHGARRDGSAFRVLYAGTLYPGLREPDRFLDGVARYVAQGGDPATLRVTYLGPSGDVLVSAAERFGVRELIEDRGSVRPREARQAMIEADLLLAIVSSNGESGVPGGKFYEYLAAGRPILAVPGTDEYVNGVLASTGAGRWASDPAEIASVLRLYVEGWRTGRTQRRPLEEVLDHSWSARARELADLLDAVTGSARRPLAPTRRV